MKENGVIRRRLSGKEADPYIGQARKILGEMKNIMQFSGIKQLSWTKDFQDGVRIVVSSIFGQDEVRIFVPVYQANEVSLPLEELPEFGRFTLWYFSDQVTISEMNVNTDKPTGRFVNLPATNFMNAAQQEIVYAHGVIWASYRSPSNTSRLDRIKIGSGDHITVASTSTESGYCIAATNSGIVAATSHNVMYISKQGLVLDTYTIPEYIKTIRVIDDEIYYLATSGDADMHPESKALGAHEETDCMGIISIANGVLESKTFLRRNYEYLSAIDPYEGTPADAVNNCALSYNRKNDSFFVKPVYTSVTDGDGAYTYTGGLALATKDQIRFSQFSALESTAFTNTTLAYMQNYMDLICSEVVIPINSKGIYVRVTKRTNGASGIASLGVKICSTESNEVLVDNANKAIDALYTFPDKADHFTWDGGNKLWFVKSNTNQTPVKASVLGYINIVNGEIKYVLDVLYNNSLTALANKQVLATQPHLGSKGVLDGKTEIDWVLELQESRV